MAVPETKYSFASYPAAANASSDDVFIRNGAPGPVIGPSIVGTLTLMVLLQSLLPQMVQPPVSFFSPRL
jgi:hypothetical protein